MGAVVRRRRERLVVQCSNDEGRNTLAAHPIADLDTVVLVGQGTHCTTPTLRFCLHREVAVVLLSTHGRLTGRLVAPGADRVDVRRAQYAVSEDPARRLPLLRAWVGAKLSNMHRRLYRRACRSTAAALEDSLRMLDRLERRLPTLENREALVGLEGAATRAYFGAWPTLIQRKASAFAFEKRSRRPPADAVNALLGFTYALLQKDVRAACATAGLDPALGLLHTPRRGVPSTVLDLMEPFRPAIADSVVLALLNRGTIQPDHFESRDGGVYLNKEGRTAVYRAYGRRRMMTITPPAYDRPLRYVRVFELQARRLARALATDDASFTPFRLS